MDDQGDLDLARQLQAEFGRAKPPKQTKRKGRRSAEVDYGNSQAPPKRQHQPPRPSQFRDHVEQTTSGRGRGSNRGRRETSSPANYPRPPWEGKLVTSDSPGEPPYTLPTQTQEAAMFFHGHHRPLPSSLPPAVSQASTRSASNAQQQDSQQSTLNNMSYFSNPRNNNSAGSFGMPLYQVTNQALPNLPIETTSLAPAVTLRRGEPLHTQQTEEQEDIEMGEADYSAAPPPKPTSANALKGLSSSMWNPANENAKADSRDSSQASLQPRPRTVSSNKKAEIVTSGLTKGPGLKASR